MTADTSHHSDAAPDDDGKCATPAERGRDEPGGLRAAVVCGLVPDEQVGPLLDLLDALHCAERAEDRATAMYPGGEPLDVACRNGYVAASLIPAHSCRLNLTVSEARQTAAELLAAARWAEPRDGIDPNAEGDTDEAGEA